jgi:hypothetical protein
MESVKTMLGEDGIVPGVIALSSAPVLTVTVVVKVVVRATVLLVKIQTEEVSHPQENEIVCSALTVIVACDM